LRNTIKNLILNSIDKTEKDSIDENESCFLEVSFNENGEISDVGFNREPKNINEEIILRKAKEILMELPKLMKVNHPRYNPLDLEIRIWFSGYCLKFNNKFWCNDGGEEEDDDSEEDDSEEDDNDED